VGSTFDAPCVFEICHPNGLFPWKGRNKYPLVKRFYVFTSCLQYEADIIAGVDPTRDVGTSE
jgi:hypothetical protein